ncbi:MAG: MerR family transcriptional regulator [Deltaproteobacteria bacterium]|nr:MerR family transcriptional regulator [Deltaproteobacteria bacterium]MBW1959864.1 MerR family transcriptional regulator [Deltaproteobacteria bacterium]MBW1993364.1 MerR family transcriptional regulator [Deltaproteobacteria bacterium]MBW2150378.1 MerR family transcriptional regulator [Deltaproteobacteria bacterium]
MKTGSASQQNIPDKLYFKIGEVSKLAGVPASVLRFWETEFFQIRPKRTPSGQRLYRKREIEMILLIKDLLYSKKYTIQGAKRYLKTMEKVQKDPFSTLDEIRSELEDIRNLLA